MFEDKLTQAQRIRLEAFSQISIRRSASPLIKLEVLLKEAAILAEFISTSAQVVYDTLDGGTTTNLRVVA